MKTYTITIGGENFPIRSDANSEDVRTLTDEIQERYQKLELKGPRYGQEFRAMSMVAIVLLAELKTIKKERDSLKNKTKQFAQNLLKDVDEILSVQKHQKQTKK